MHRPREERRDGVRWSVTEVLTFGMEAKGGEEEGKVSQTHHSDLGISFGTNFHSQVLPFPSLKDIASLSSYLIISG